jgi:hypothetical protein
MRTAPKTSPLTDLYDRWNNPSYEIRVRGTMYLWGSAGVTKNVKFDKPLLLHVRNDVFGEVVTFGTQVASGTQTTIGTLQPGECVSVPIQDISGVFASCALESVVGCVIKQGA